MSTAPRDSRHATVMQAYIKDMQKEGYTLVGVEVPYNYYGQRGFIDVVLKRTTGNGEEWLVSEIKSQLTDIGEAIRQVNRAREYFFKGARLAHSPVQMATYNLILLATDANVHLWMMHRSLFDGVRVDWQVSDDIPSAEAMGRLEVSMAVASLHDMGPMFT